VLDAGIFAEFSEACHAVLTQELGDLIVGGADGDRGVLLNGRPGQAWEDFYIPRIDDRTRPIRDPQGRTFAFCKTARKPYDLAVTCCLLLFKDAFDDVIDVKTDGQDHDWEAARRVVGPALKVDWVIVDDTLVAGHPDL
jgi:hypothetical protein